MIALDLRRRSWHIYVALIQWIYRNEISETLTSMQNYKLFFIYTFLILSYNSQIRCCSCDCSCEFIICHSWFYFSFFQFYISNRASLFIIIIYNIIYSDALFFKFWYFSERSKHILSTLSGSDSTQISENFVSARLKINLYAFLVSFFTSSAINFINSTHF